jgi:predicted membrane-bound dolichyl-phosphate-mannose-protein mannosyltransferase
MSDSKLYSIPARFRRTENLHILFWLMKDICWAMLWKPVGVAMLVPTLLVAIIITWQTRHLVAELFHNLAITFWICANGYWMIVEFLGKDEQLRIFTAIPFGIGLFFIATYYLVVLPREKRREKMMPVSVEVPQDTLKTVK